MSKLQGQQLVIVKQQLLPEAHVQLSNMVGLILGQLTYGSIVLHANVVSVLVPSLLPNGLPW